MMAIQFGQNQFGINDALNISVSIFKMTKARPLPLDIYFAQSNQSNEGMDVKIEGTFEYIIQIIGNIISMTSLVISISILLSFK